MTRGYQVIKESPTVPGDAQQLIGRDAVCKSNPFVFHFASSRQMRYSRTMERDLRTQQTLCVPLRRLFADIFTPYVSRSSGCDSKFHLRWPSHVERESRRRNICVFYREGRCCEYKVTPLKVSLAENKGRSRDARMYRLLSSAFVFRR